MKVFLEFKCQIPLETNKTVVEKRRSADQVQPAYVGSVFESSVPVEKLTGHNPTEDIPFVKAIEELAKVATTYHSQKKFRKNLVTQPTTTF